MFSTRRAEGIRGRHAGAGTAAGTGDDPGGADERARWEREANACLPFGMPRRLCFSFVTNNCADDGTERSRVTTADSSENAKAIPRAVAAMAPTVAIDPLSILDDNASDRRIKALDNQLTELYASLDVPCLPVFAAMRTSVAWTTDATWGDCTHLDAEGYAVLADTCSYGRRSGSGSD